MRTLLKVTVFTGVVLGLAACHSNPSSQQKPALCKQVVPMFYCADKLGIKLSDFDSSRSYDRSTMSKFIMKQNYDDCIRQVNALQSRSAEWNTIKANQVTMNNELTELKHEVDQLKRDADTAK